MGYGTGAVLGRGVKGVRSVHWLEDPGIAPALWLMEVETFGPFIGDGDLDSNSLFERENAAIEESIRKAYDGTRPRTVPMTQSRAAWF